LAHGSTKSVASISWRKQRAQYPRLTATILFLSNFFPSPVRANGIMYPSVEHAYQAFKSPSIDIREQVAKLPTAGKAKRFGQTIALRDEWDKRADGSRGIKYDVMEMLVRFKFRQHPHLAALLLATGDAVLIEGNSWGDEVWGVNKRTNTGENALGNILMRVRAELRSSPYAHRTESVHSARAGGPSARPR